MNVLIFGAGGISAGVARYLAQEPDTRVTEVPRDIVDVKRERDVRTYLSRWLGWLDHDAEVWIINCAGVDDEQDPYETIKTNLIGGMHVIQQAAIERGLPTISIASVAGLYGKPDHPAYCASKAGLISLVQSHGFRYPVWAISPGRVDTPMRDARYPNDTPGSRLSPENIGFVVRDIMDGTYASGANVIIRKIGADPDAVIEVEEEVNPWRDVLRVGQPLTI